MARWMGAGVRTYAGGHVQVHCERLMCQACQLCSSSLHMGVPGPWRALASHPEIPLPHPIPVLTPLPFHLQAGVWRDGKLEAEMEEWQCALAVEGAGEAAAASSRVQVWQFGVRFPCFALHLCDAAAHTFGCCQRCRALPLGLLSPAATLRPLPLCRWAAAAWRTRCSSCCQTPLLGPLQQRQPWRWPAGSSRPPWRS